MGWFQIAATPSGREFSLVVYRSGQVPDLRSPGAAPKASSSNLDLVTPLGLLSRLINLTVYRGSWTVEVAPWRGWRGPKRRIRVLDEATAEARAAELSRLIESGGWNPADQPEPPELRA